MRLQLVLEELFAEQVQAVASDAAQDGMHGPRSKLAVCGIKKRAQDRHGEDQTAAAKALGKRLGVPSKDAHRPPQGKDKKTASDPPVDGGGRTGIVVWLLQNRCSPLLWGFGVSS